MVLLWPDQLAGVSVTIGWAGEPSHRVVAFPARITVPFDRPIHVHAMKNGFETFVRDVMLSRAASRAEIVIEMQELVDATSPRLSCRKRAAPWILAVRREARRAARAEE